MTHSGGKAGGAAAAHGWVQGERLVDASQGWFPTNLVEARPDEDDGPDDDDDA